MKLIIVESPTKARTLSKFLAGGEYRIEATMGHIRDLPKKSLGVDVATGFTPTYVVDKERKKRVGELQSIAKDADQILLATDPDREGEAIAWHARELLANSNQQSAKKPKKKKKADAESRKPVLPAGRLNTDSFQRITFHEITPEAIKDALDHPHEIDMKLVDAQQARRILDRLVGYKLSPLLWKKLSRRWLSAGRVQSVTVRLIVEREREIERFTKEPYFTIEATFQGSRGPIPALLVYHNGTKYETTEKHTLFDGAYTVSKTSIGSETEAQAIIKAIAPPYTVSSIEKKEVRRSPAPPYTTSTLQQDAGRKFYFSAKKTMQCAQKLYEEGFITYHRTDSVTLSEKFLTEARSFVQKSYGDSYLPEQSRRYKTKSKVAQEAHEAIRPTRISLSSEDLKKEESTNHDLVRLYSLIWKRAVASQMADAVFDATTIQITSANQYLFQAQGSVLKFEGYLKVLERENGETILPDVKEGETLNVQTISPVSHETLPPPRYSEASLVKALEEKDIGRPSTYAPIITTVIDRQYVKKEEKRLMPTDLGFAVTDFLVSHFPEIMSLPFTAGMEDKLDAIANGDVAWVPVLSQFYTPFEKILDQTYETAETVKLPVEMLDEKCPTCGNPLVIRTGRYGKFIACSTFPACTYKRQKKETIDTPCPRCGNLIAIKRTRKGKMFYGCTNYPTCTFAAWKKEDIK